MPHGPVRVLPRSSVEGGSRMTQLASRAALSVLGLSSMLAIACAPQPLTMELASEEERSLLLGDPSESRQVNVIVYDRKGEMIRTPKVRWYSINPKIADVSSTGVIVPKSEGHTTIVARSGFTQREVPVKVHYFSK